MFGPKVFGLIVTVLAATTVAHPGEDAFKEAQKRAAFLAALGSTDMAHCADKLIASGHADRIMNRRAEQVAELRRHYGLDHKPMLTERDLVGVLGKSHKSSQPVNSSTPMATVFGQNKSCVLTPEITEGPYWVSGELIRQNITDTEKGIPLTFNILTLDHKTCKPLAGEWVEIWSVNGTGIYSGVAASGNGNINDLSNLNRTYLRGLQQADKDGITTYHTLMPGHYIVRANHIHIMTHYGAKLLPNNTIVGGTVAHIGQVYFDQSLLEQVEKTAPYNTNRQAWTKNANDPIISLGVANNDDPIINYSLLGSKIEDGVFGWITVGADVTNKRTVNQASWYSAQGGIKNPNAAGIGSFIFPGGNTGGAAGGGRKPPK